MNKWFKVQEGEPEIVPAFCNYGATDYLVPKSVSGGHGYLPRAFYNELMTYDDDGLRQFNYKVSPNEYRRSFVTKDDKPMYDISIGYVVKYWSLRALASIYNIYVDRSNKYTDFTAMSYGDANELLALGKTIGIMTHIGCARQWWFKRENGELIYGTFSNDPNTVKDWKRYEDAMTNENVLPTHWKYKVAV